MESKTIKISSENYRWLARLAAEAQKRKERPVSLDEALSEIKTKKSNKKLLEFAGIWKISDKEAEELKSNLKKGWNSWKTKSV
ncbi:MAG: hypothetical protein AABW79_04185 [Nanoarchaeota archaeon]